MANSGGGVIIVGVNDDGSPSGADIDPVLRLDPAHLTDKMFRYTGEHFSGFRISAVTVDSVQVAEIAAEGVDELLVFTRPGNYISQNGKQRTAFAIGGVYFRHGAKSEPCTASDLRRHTQQRISRERERWMKGIQQVVNSPVGSEVALVEPSARDQQGNPTRVRLTNEPDAPVFGRLNPDDTHPHRQSNVVKILNDRLGARGSINAHDVLSVRVAHGIDDSTHPEFAYKPKYDSMHYSDLFIEWMDSQHMGDPEFFRKARATYEQSRAGRPG
jgi:hypothetical protein